MYQNVKEIATAIAVVNKNAKTAIDPTELYNMKKNALTKLMNEGQAKKLGLHFSKHPKNAKQISDLLIKVGNYYFHLPATKEDRKNLTHLGHLNDSVRNPPTTISLNKAKQILLDYLGTQITMERTKNSRKRQYIGPSPYLNNWSPPYPIKKGSAQNKNKHR